MYYNLGIFTIASLLIISSGMVFADSNISDCESMYTQFTSLGESKFLTMHSYSSVSTSCVLLYHDSVWNYHRSDRVDVLSDRLEQIYQELGSFEIITPENKNIDVSINKINIIPTTTNEYLSFFEICSLHSYAQISGISFSSDIDSIEIPMNYLLSPRTCLMKETQISANNPDTINVQTLSISDVTSFDELKLENQTLKEQLKQKDAIIAEQIDTLTNLANQIKSILFNGIFQSFEQF